MSSFIFSDISQNNAKVLEKKMAENAAETQGAVTDSAPTGESSKIMSD